MTFLAPNRFKILTTVAIFVTFIAAEWLGQVVVGWFVMPSIPPQIISNMADSMKPYMHDLIGSREWMRIAVLTYLVQGIVLLVLAYLCAAVIATFRDKPNERAAA